MPKPHVVIIGGGFAGLEAAKTLKKAPVKVTLIDRRNHHLFQPLLYQVATAGLSAPDIAAPIRQILRKQKNTTVLLGDVDHIDVEGKRVCMGDEALSYDHLILAAGAGNNYFGNDDWARHAPGLKSVEEALYIRHKVLQAYEAAERIGELNSAAIEPYLTFVVVGGGPTGVELAGALSEIAHHTLARDFRNFDPKAARIVLIDGGARVLSGMDPESSQWALEALADKGVEVVLQSRVTAIDGDGVTYGDGVRVPAKTIIWAAGVKPSSLTDCIPGEKVRGHVVVQPDLTVPDHPEISVVGDVMAFKEGDSWLPGVAQVALQSGRQAAKNIVRRIQGETPETFSYFDKGMMATIGRSAAVVETGGRKVQGFFAWVLWWMVHIMFLVGFRNRLAVMFEWVYAYFTWSRGARVIVRPPPKEIWQGAETSEEPSAREQAG
ncbi:MAG: NAD(P)/FAD-dependent oxidoreductase [Bradymonadia bacterium]